MFQISNLERRHSTVPTHTHTQIKLMYTYIEKGKTGNKRKAFAFSSYWDCGNHFCTFPSNFFTDKSLKKRKKKRERENGTEKQRTTAHYESQEN